jgi:hypothetical protein
MPTAPARPGHQFVEAQDITAGRVVLEVGRYDPATQVLDQTYIHIGADGVDLRPLSLRLAFPPEFDLMARLAGLRLRDRWGGWTGDPYTSTSWRHVSVYEHS